MKKSLGFIALALLFSGCSISIVSRDLPTYEPGPIPTDQNVSSINDQTANDVLVVRMKTVGIDGYYKIENTNGSGQESDFYRDGNEIVILSSLETISQGETVTFTITPMDSEKKSSKSSIECQIALWRPQKGWNNPQDVEIETGKLPFNPSEVLDENSGKGDEPVSCSYELVVS